VIRRQNAIVDRQTGKIIVQTPLPPINCLAFEGGGSRCAAFTGLHRVLSKAGVMDSVEHVSGTSGGAIYALAVALGYEPDEAETLLLELNMEHFLEGYHSWLSQSGLWSKGKAAFSIWYNNGHSLSSGKEFLNWLEIIVEKKLGNKKATFADLARRVAEEKNQKGEKINSCKYLYVTGTNLSFEMPECKFLSHETEPDMPLALAVALSGAYPFVMEPVRWNNHLYGDGGLMWNLPTKIFDDRRFLPAGYDFNEKGLNPGVLAIKIDSQVEIDQVIWGKRKEVYLKSASEVATAVYNALAQNTDTAEVREARMTVALPDNNISVLDFAVSRAGKLGLIAAAERETQNFVENYYRTAFDLKVYDNVVSWLDSLSMDDIDDVIATYEEMKLQLQDKQPGKTKALVSDQQGDLDSHVLPVSDANQPTLSELEEYIVFLEDYLRYRRMKKRRPECEFKPRSVPLHINIKPRPVCLDWSIRVEKNMQRKLSHVLDELEYCRLRLQSIKMDFTDSPAITPLTQLHHRFYFENIQALTCLREYQKLLLEEKKELEIKLGTFDKTKEQYSSEMSRNYAAFMQILNPLLTVSQMAPELKAVLPEQLPVMKMESSSYASNIVFMLDLHNELDRKIYIVAALLYLTQKKSRSREVFIRLFQEFVVKDALLPANMEALGKVLKLDGYELLREAYRMEELLHHFEKHENPKATPVMNIDTIFGVDKLKSKHDSSLQSDGALSMKHIIRTSSIFSRVDDKERDGLHDPSRMGEKKRDDDGSSLPFFMKGDNKEELTVSEKLQSQSTGRNSGQFYS